MNWWKFNGDVWNIFLYFYLDMDATWLYLLPLLLEFLYLTLLVLLPSGHGCWINRDNKGLAWHHALPKLQSIPTPSFISFIPGHPLNSRHQNVKDIWDSCLLHWITLVYQHLLAFDSNHTLYSLAIMHVPTLSLPPAALAAKAELSHPLCHDMSLTQGPMSAGDQGQDYMPITPECYKTRSQLINY